MSSATEITGAGFGSSTGALLSVNPRLATSSLRGSSSCCSSGFSRSTAEKPKWANSCFRASSSEMILRELHVSASSSDTAADAFDSQKLRNADLSPPAMASSRSVDRFTRPSSVSRF
ncbi:hypothetical protein KC19_10G040900 [Ceratodon purpureus]|uniref:Uncharacterized protein n=1 Tax=Ceratodon purpureus TaxID=3225 RepID=A0A8T0GJ52_CERPU|nr:hypothetical protein KC19_10G040900 [Ceratodon purpureus]